jgi:hypothetical protein
MTVPRNLQPAAQAYACRHISRIFTQILALSLAVFVLIGKGTHTSSDPVILKYVHTWRVQLA